MSFPRNLTGMQFHELTVIELADFRLQRHRVYKCRCSCDKICYVRSNRLTTGNTKSCGHLKRQKARSNNKKRIDFQGQQIDDFIVDMYSNNDKKTHSAVWRCHCVRCGAIRYLQAYQLRGHYKTKCDCRNKEMSELCK